MKSVIALAGCLFMAVSAAQAGTIVNLNASSTNPNAGTNSGGYPFNPIVVTLGAGTYSVGVIGKASGGAYDAYAVYADNGSNAAWTDSSWSVSFDGGATAAFTEANLGRTNTALMALATYSAVAPYVFTLTGTKSVSFYVDDTAQPFFADDTGGVSLAITTAAAAVPEPASLLLLGMGATAAMVTARRRRGLI